MQIFTFLDLCAHDIAVLTLIVFTYIYILLESTPPPDTLPLAFSYWPLFARVLLGGFGEGGTTMMRGLVSVSWDEFALSWKLGLEFHVGGFPQIVPFRLQYSL